jgi:hypothetical protein
VLFIAFTSHVHGRFIAPYLVCGSSVWVKFLIIELSSVTHETHLSGLAVSLYRAAQSAQDMTIIDYRASRLRSPVLSANHSLSPSRIFSSSWKISSVAAFDFQLGFLAKGSMSSSPPSPSWSPSLPCLERPNELNLAAA